MGAEKGESKPCDKPERPMTGDEATVEATGTVTVAGRSRDRAMTCSDKLRAMS